MRILFLVFLTATILRADVTLTDRQLCNLRTGKPAKTDRTWKTEIGWKVPQTFMEGNYYLLFKFESGTVSGNEFLPRNLFLNSKAIAFKSASPYEKSGSSWALTAQSAEKHRIRPGDVFSFQPKRRGRVISLTFSEKPLSFAPNPVEHAQVPDQKRFSTDLCRFGENLRISLKNVSGLDLSAVVHATIRDFYGEKVGETQSDTLEFICPFRKTDAAQYRAEIRIRDNTGRTERHVLHMLRDTSSGMRKTLHLNRDWQMAEVPDDGTLKTRILQPAPPVRADWRSVNLPSVWKTPSAWYRREFAIPPAFRGERYILHFRRLPYEADLYVNGKKAYEHRVEQAFAPVAADITSLVNPEGKNVIQMCVLGKIAGTTLKERSGKTVNLNGERRAYNHLTHGISECMLETVPSVFLSGIRIETSLAEKRIKVHCPPLPEGCRIDNRIFFEGKEVFRFGTQGVWRNPILWGPTDFPLLKLETRLLDGNGRLLDRKLTRFGFREIRTDGMDLLWNGKRVFMQARAIHANTWYDWRLPFNSRKMIQEHLQTFRERGIRALRHVNNDSIFAEIADEEGIVYAQGLSPVAAPTPQMLGEDTFWRNKHRNDVASLHALFNHPSIFFWYISNEFYAYSYDRNFQRIADIYRCVAAEDRTRLTEAGCDLDLRGLARHISTHYPIDVSIWRSEQTNLPEMLYWRHLNERFHKGDAVPKGQCKVVCNVVGTSKIRWGEKPIVVNETGWNVFCSPPHAQTRFAGERPYAGYAAVDTLWREQLKLNTQGQRDAGACILTPWTSLKDDDPETICPENDVVILQRYRSAYPGTKLVFDINLFHGAFREETLEYFHTLSCNGKIVRSESEKIRFDFAQTERRKIAVVPDAPGLWTLTAGLRGVRTASHSFRVEKRIPAVKGTIIRADDRMEKNLLDRVHSGETVLILPRRQLPSWFPVQLETTHRTASINYTFRRDHPFLKGISGQELSFWLPNHRTGTEYFRKPDSRNGMAVVEAGGPEGLIYAGLLDIPYGKGRFVVSRLDLNPEINPVAAKLLRNIFQAPPHRPFRKAGVLAKKNSAFLRFLQSAGVEYTIVRPGEWGDCDILLADGTEPPPDAFPGTVFVFKPGRAWGVEVENNLPLVLRGRAWQINRKDKVMDGLNSFDFFWRSNIREQAYRKIFESAEYLDGELADGVIRSGAEPLCYPAVLGRRGNIIFCLAKLDTENPKVRSKARRIFSTLMTNLGVALRPTERRGLPKNLRFTPVDLSKFLDRTFHDDIDNDGKGGWSDQGPEIDFREFPHPAGIHTFHGIRFRIERPLSCFALASKYRKGGYSEISVPVKRKAEYLAILQTSAWTGAGVQYIIEVLYDDGSRQEIPMRNKINLRDWASPSPNRPFDPDPNANTFNRCFLTGRQKTFGQASVYSTVWRNPEPEKTIQSVIFRSLKKNVAIILALSTGNSTRNVHSPEEVDQKTYARRISFAETLRKKGKIREAIKVYESILEDFPSVLEPYRSLCDCYETLGDWKAAEEICRRALKADINQPDMFNRIEKLKQRRNRK